MEMLFDLVDYSQESKIEKADYKDKLFIYQMKKKNITEVSLGIILKVH